MARAGDENIIFMALPADTRPHFTTIAAFISGRHEQVASVFRDVLLGCDELGLIGREMFAIDGCQLPANAARHNQERQRFEGRSDQYTAKDFTYDADAKTCHCPAGHKLYSNGRNPQIKGYSVHRFRASVAICQPCGHRARGFKNPAKTHTRQVAIFLGKADKSASLIEKMKAKIDSLAGRRIYARRMGTVEPVFGNHFKSPTRSLHPARQDQGQRPVAAVLGGA